MSADIVKVDAIRVEDRARRDYSGIDTLAASIDSLGLLHPIVVTPDLRLVAGGRRLEAVRALGWVSVPVTVFANLSEAASMLQAESDENTERMPLRPTEAADLARKIEEVLAPMARERMIAGVAPSPNLGKGQASAKVAAKATGYGHETIRKVRVVQEVIESDSTPEPVREIARAALAQMDDTGRVDGPARTVRDALAAAVDSQALQDSRYVTQFVKELGAIDKLWAFDAERIGRNADRDVLDTLRSYADQFEKFARRVEVASSGLRIIEGGRK